MTPDIAPQERPDPLKRFYFLQHELVVQLLQFGHPEHARKSKTITEGKFGKVKCSLIFHNNGTWSMEIDGINYRVGPDFESVLKAYVRVSDSQFNEMKQRHFGELCSYMDDFGNDGPGPLKADNHVIQGMSDTIDRQTRETHAYVDEHKSELSEQFLQRMEQALTELRTPRDPNAIFLEDL